MIPLSLPLICLRKNASQFISKIQEVCQYRFNQRSRTTKMSSASVPPSALPVLCTPSSNVRNKATVSARQAYEVRSWPSVQCLVEQVAGQELFLGRAAVRRALRSVQGHRQHPGLHQPFEPVTPGVRAPSYSSLDLF